MDNPDALTLDGNALGAVLAEVFHGAELTGAARACASCGQRHAIGEHRLYRGAGLVLRCPGCGDVALTIVEGDGVREVRFSGAWAVRLPVPAG
jgi:Zn finger protein HypA/HybF involved in hydrogenase expression